MARRGHNGYGQPAVKTARKFQTKTAADIAREQAAREQLLQGTEDMRRALERPGSLFRLRCDVRSHGPMTALPMLVQTGRSDPAPSAGMRQGAVLVFVGRGRADDGQGINRPVHLFLVMGLASRFVVADFALIEPVVKR